MNSSSIRAAFGLLTLHMLLPVCLSSAQAQTHVAPQLRPAAEIVAPAERDSATVPAVNARDATTDATPEGGAGRPESATSAVDDSATHAELERALARYAHEPPVAEVVAAAVRAQGVAPGRVSDLASRARTSAWLPTLRLTARRGQTIALLAAQSTTIDRNSASSGDNLVLEAQLSFDLAKLLWSGEEPRIEREMREERDALAKLAATITSLYFERRRLQVERDQSDTADVGRAIRIAEISGALDVLTGGEFTRGLRRERR